jgi:hypothetical protein
MSAKKNTRKEKPKGILLCLGSAANSPLPSLGANVKKKWGTNKLPMP